MPEKYVRLVKYTYEDTMPHFNVRVSVTAMITLSVGPHQGSLLSPYMCGMMLEVRGKGIKALPPW